MNQETLERCMYAARDQARLYRRLRRDVSEGVIDHYSVEECTQRMKDAEALACELESELNI